MVICAAQSMSASKTPDITKCGAFQNFKSAAYLDVAVDLQALPKEQASAQLRHWATTGLYEVQVIILCRMLFESKLGPKYSTWLTRADSFRRPGLGGPLFCGSPHQFASSFSSPLFVRFNLEPICIVDGVPFLIVRSYIIAGLPAEPAYEYLNYCLGNTNWTPFRYKRATKEMLDKAYNKFAQTSSKDWQLDEAELKFLHEQIELSPSGNEK